MLTDVLGIAIAFVVIMLVLSIMTTSLVQATQFTLRLRGRNIHKGVARAITQTSSLDAADSKKTAYEILNSAAVVPLGGATKPTSFLAKFIGPKVTWVEPEIIKEAIAEIESEKSVDADKIVGQFKKSDLHLRKRFATRMRIVSILWALVIAGVFQLSTPALVEQLSVDPALRHKIASQADEVIEFASSRIGQENLDASIYVSVIQTMVHKYPDLKVDFEGLDTDTPWIGDLSEELADVIETHDRADAIVLEFEDALSDAYVTARDASLESAKLAANQLSMFDITPFRQGVTFYKSWENLVGILMTVVLLSLGAPFWFNALKTAVSFRDLLQPSLQGVQGDKGRDSNKSGGNGNE